MGYFRYTKTLLQPIVCLLQKMLHDYVNYLANLFICQYTEYSESLVRRMIEKITVYDDHFVVEFKSSIEITINK